MPASSIREETVKGPFFDKVYSSLIGRGMKLIEGPRGCGKTHMMRYAWVECLDDKNKPLPIYVTFNRYYRLEPLLQKKANAVDYFHLWVLIRVVISLYETLDEFENRSLVRSGFKKDFDIDFLMEVVGTLERGQVLSEDEILKTKKISPTYVTNKINNLSSLSGRKRAVLFMDDAALTLTPEYMHEFFDILRTFKHEKISPKASVYPGTTEYGPKFHADHEAEKISVWLSPDNESYHDVMRSIAQKRFPEVCKIPESSASILRYAAFGVPRAYLTMLREFMKSEGGNSQSNINKIIDAHRLGRISEYESLKIKMPKFSSVIDSGMVAIEVMAKDLATDNIKKFNGNTKQLIVGVPEGSVGPMASRMFSILMEAGLLYEYPAVSHGEDRSYRRFTPHLALLIANRAFSGGRRGQSHSGIVSFLDRKQEKHPLRRSLSSLLTEDQLNKLAIDLPPCSHCQAPRVKESQLFCHMCGSELLDVSSFSVCMSVNLVDVPGLTNWQKERIRDLESLDTVGDLLANQDPGTELRKIHRVGEKKAKKIIKLVTVFVDEFLS